MSSLLCAALETLPTWPAPARASETVREAESGKDRFSAAHRWDDASDQELIAAARRGNRPAFAHLVKRYEAQVARTATGMLGRGPDAEDVGQETMLLLYRNLGKFRGESSLATYLIRIAIHLSLRALKKRRGWLSFLEPQLLAELATVPRADSADTVVERSQQGALVARALETLRPDERAVVVLRVVHEYSTKEVAKMLGVREGTVMSRLSRSLAKLAPSLEEVSS
jgi:RNA polymerase sigma-70 factor, ECF subfamily